MFLLMLKEFLIESTQQARNLHGMATHIHAGNNAHYPYLLGWAR
jgi:hypothetical protein